MSDTSETSTPSSLEDSAISSFTESRWNAQKAKSPVQGHPSLDRNFRDASSDCHLMRKRRYPNASSNLIEGQSSATPLLNNKSDAESEVLLKCIRKNFLFAHLAEEKQQYILAALEKMTVRKNECLFCQGDPSEFCFLVCSGEVDLEVDGKPLESEKTEEEEGHILGQLALLTGSPYAETAKSTSSSCVVFFLSREHFQRAMIPPEAIEEEERIHLLKRSIPSDLLNYLEDDEAALNKLAAGMSTRSFFEGDVLYQTSNRLTIVIEGKVIASLEGRGYEDLFIGPGEAQTSFGWRIFASQARVAHKLRAATDGKAITITKEAFANAFGSHGGSPLLKHLATRRSARIQLQQITAFKDSELDFKQLNGLLDLMHHCEYSHAHEEVIMKAGEKIEPAMHFVREGSVRLETNKGKDKQVIEAGGYFGDKNMLLDQNKSGKTHSQIRAVATVFAHPNTKVDVLYLEECRKIVDTTLLGLGKPVPVSAVDASIDWTRLKRHAMLGAGGFGQVWLASVPERNTDDATVTDKRRIVALKIQAKHPLVDVSQSKQAVAERNIMASLNSPFVIQLYSSFQDKERLYMITSVMQGGELDSLIPANGLPESAARFYAAGILEGLTYMHRHHIIHRDVKPPNVLIDDRGYPVLIDLGFAKYVPDKSYTWCGSPFCVSPEIIRMQGHNKSTDHWSWAILVFKLVTGRYPFRGKNEFSLYQKICRASFEVVGSFEFRALMVAMLYPDPSKRLGSVADGWRDIFDHPWFHVDDSFNLPMLRKRDMPAPWVPNAKDQFDTSKFLPPTGARDLMQQDCPELDGANQEAFSSFGQHFDAVEFQ